MSEDCQNQDLHWVSVMSTENRISANHLSDESKNKVEAVRNINNTKFLPCRQELELQRSDYATLICRIITKHIDCLKFLNDVTLKHILHRYSRETSKPTETVSRCFLLDFVLEIILTSSLKYIGMCQFCAYIKCLVNDSKIL